MINVITTTFQDNSIYNAFNLLVNSSVTGDITTTLKESSFYLLVFGGVQLAKV